MYPSVYSDAALSTPLSHWESRALGPGEGLLNLLVIDECNSRNHALPGRYRVRPSRKREGEERTYSPLNCRAC